jgi:hypothetical protein
MKIVVIGLTGYQHSSNGIVVTSYLWSELKRIENLRDFDLVIMDLTVPGWNDVEPVTFLNKISFEVTRDIIAHGGEVIVIGDPRSTIKTRHRQFSFTAWTGVSLSWDDSSGSSIQITSINDRYKEYLKSLRSWQYALEHFQIQYDASQLARVEIHSLAENRYAKPLAFEIRYYFGQGRVGCIVFLPETTLDQESRLQLVLRDMCGVDLNRHDPPWIDTYVAPTQPPLDKIIDKLEAETYKLQTELDRRRLELKEVRTCLRLLFDSGLTLEMAVRKVLRELGASVREPIEANKEDGWISISGGPDVLEGVLEIKSTSKDTFNEDGIRQAVEWRTRGIERDGKRYKGIFIGVSAIDKQPSERTDPFGQGWKRSAKLQQIVGIRSEELYEAYALNCKGELDASEFWRAVFQTDGVFSLSSFLGR